LGPPGEAAGGRARSRTAGGRAGGQNAQSRVTARLTLPVPTPGRPMFELCDQTPKAETCEAIKGLIEEGKEVMDEAEEGAVMDAGLIASAQVVEHYEIARYGTLIAWAKQLGMGEAADLLEETLEQEKNADKKLTQIAMSNVNRQAA